MPKKLNSKVYDSLTVNMDRMAEGVAKHKGDEGFANRADDGLIRADRQKLEDFRTKYEMSAGETQRAYDEFFDFFKYCSAQLSKNSDTMRGFYGKKNAILSDYGIKVLDPPKKRTTKTNKPKS